MPKLPNPQIRPWSQHTCTRSTSAQVATPALASTAVTSATGTTLVNSGATWTTNQYQNFWVTILTGTGAGQTRNITSNTSTTLTVPTWTVNPDNTSTFQIVNPLYPGLQGSLAPGAPTAAVLVGVTYREVVPTAGAAEVTARLKTTTAAGTLTLTPIRLLAVNPDDPSITDGLGNVDTTKVQKYSTGGSSATAVVAGTELALTVNPAGEAYCLLEFACTTAGTLNYCDVMTLQAPGNITTSGGGGGSSAVTIADGADVTLGSIADAAVGDASGTINAHLRQVAKSLAGTLTVTGGGGGPATLASGAVASGAYAAGSIASGAAVAGAFADGAIATIGTEADAAVVNPALSATEIAALKGILTVLQAAPTAPTPVDGWVAAGSAASGENPVLIGGSDTSGNVQNVPLVLLNLAATYATQLGLMTKSLLASRDGTSIITNSSPHDIGADGVSLNNGASVGAFVWDSVAGAWDRLQGPVGDNQGPTGVIANVEMLYNGTTNKYDRRRGNIDITGLASAARTATTATADLINYNHSGVIVIINVTALTATGTLTVTVNGKDSLSGVYYPLLTSSAIATTGTTVLYVRPGTVSVANVISNLPVPRIFQINCVAGNSVSITYSVGVSFVV